MKDSQLIEAVTRGRHESECQCDICQSLCRHTPCIGTPSDILRLIGEGYLDNLTLTRWGAGNRIGVPEIEMVQLDALECGACPMFEAGRCAIHHMKPTEGRLASHVPCHMAESPSTAVALTWLLPRNEPIVRHIFSLFNYDPVHP